jgi:glycosyl transferase family 1
VLAGAERVKLSELILLFARDIGCADAVDVYPCPTQEVKMKLFSGTDIFVSPGDGVPESFGLAAIEAMASGLPCILSDWDGYRETIVSGKTGFLVPTSWSILGPCVEAFEGCHIQPVSTLAATTVLDLDALENYLKLLVEDANLRRTMGLAAREYVLANFDWSVVVPQYDDLFDQQLSLVRSGSLNGARREITRLSSMQSLFAHYPTQTIPLDSPIFLTEAGKKWMQSPFTLGAAMAKNELIDDALCVQIAEVLGAEGVLSLNRLIQKASERAGASPWVVQINSMRLLKYGVAGWSEPQIELLQNCSELMPVKED